MNTEIEGILPSALTIPSDTKAKYQFWQEEVRRWKASGKKQSVYSKERGLPTNRLNYWVGKLRKHQKPSSLAPSGKLVSIGMQKKKEEVLQQQSLQCIRIKRTNGTWIELPLLDDMTQLKALLEVLGC